MRARAFANRAAWGLAFVLALVGGPTGAAGVLHHVLHNGRACCAPAVSDAAAPVLGAAASPLDAAAAHCGTCHGLCSLRYQAPEFGALGMHEEELGLVDPVRFEPASTDGRLQLPARAPPPAFA